MAIAEDLMKEAASKTPAQYAGRVRWMALIYIGLNLLSLAAIITIAWRVKFFITLAQRSNVETLTLAIIFILAVYYIASTFRGFIGALRMAWLNLPTLISRSESSLEKAERRKHNAIGISKGESKYVCLDQAVRLQGKPQDAISWQVADDVGKLGELVLDGVKLTYYPLRNGMNNSLFVFVLDKLEQALQRQDLEADLEITQWSSIDKDAASAYYSTVKAFCNLEGQLGDKGPLWPRRELTQEDVDNIADDLRKLVPTLRNEAFLPDLEYAVEYNVPVLPEPLGFIKLTRNESRADPVVSMGCAGLVMLGLVAVLVFFILLPPWLPAK